MVFGWMGGQCCDLVPSHTLDSVGRGVCAEQLRGSRMSECGVAVWSVADGHRVVQAGAEGCHVDPHAADADPSLVLSASPALPWSEVDAAAVAAVAAPAVRLLGCFAGACQGAAERLVMVGGGQAR